MLNFACNLQDCSPTTDYTNSSDAWYTLDGRRLNGKPATRGIYVNSGRLVNIK